jgi:hypothetical protein
MSPPSRICGLFGVEAYVVNSVSEFGTAWLALGVVFGLHVMDEALHHFLDWYNPIAKRIRDKLGGLPFPPSFTFWPWLIGLLVATATFLLLTPLAYDGRAWLKPVAITFALINVFNGLLHLVAATVLRRLVPGVLSAPILLVVSVWLFYAAIDL